MLYIYLFFFVCSYPLAALSAAMVKVVSRVSRKLAKCEVLFAPGGKDGILKRPAAPDNHRPNELRWANVVAPAYISG